MRVDADVEPERIEEDNPVGAEDDVGPCRPELRRPLELATRHQRLGGEREVGLALDRDRAEQVDVEAEPRHDRVAVAVEGGVVAAERQHELAAVRPLEPRHEREPTGEANLGEEQPGVIRQLGLDPEDALLGGEAADQPELDRDERELRPRQRHSSEAEQRQLEPVADRDRDDGDAVDEREAVEADPGREPELTLANRECVLVLREHRHRVRRRRRAGVERLDEGERPELAEVLREDEVAVDPDATADPGQEERRRTADRPVDRAEGEEAGERLARRAASEAVAAEHRQAVDAEAPEQHADVLDGVRLAGRPGLAELAQAADEGDPAEVGGDRETGEVDGPPAGVEDGSVRADDERQRQVVDRRGEAEDRYAPVEQQRDRLQVALLDLRVEADLFYVHRPEPLLDREPPRAGRIAGAQRDERLGRRLLLHRDGRAELRRQLRLAAAGVLQHALRDLVAAARAGRADREVAQLQLDAAADPCGAADLAVEVDADGRKGDARDLEQGATRTLDADADPVDLEAGFERDLVRVRADAEQPQQQPRPRRRRLLDPRRVELEAERDVAAAERVAILRDQLDAEHVGRRLDERQAQLGKVELRLRDADEVQAQPLQPGKHLVDVEQARHGLPVRALLVYDDALEDVAHRRDAAGAAEHVTHGVRPDDDAGGEVDNGLDGGKRNGGRVGLLRGAVDCDERERTAEQPARSDRLRAGVVEGEAELSAPAARRARADAGAEVRTKGGTAGVDDRRPDDEVEDGEPAAVGRRLDAGPAEAGNVRRLGDEPHRERVHRHAERHRAERHPQLVADDIRRESRRERRPESRGDRVQRTGCEGRRPCGEASRRVGRPRVQLRLVELGRRPGPEAELVADGAHDRAGVALQVVSRLGRERVQHERQRLLHRSRELAETRRVRVERDVRAGVGSREDLDAAVDGDVDGAAPGRGAREADGELDPRLRDATRREGE